MEFHHHDGNIVPVDDSNALEAAMSSIAKIPDGGVIELKESARHSIQAKRDDLYWIVTAKRPGWWFRQTLTTGNWIDPSKRKRKPFWVERGTLDDASVRKVFLEFFEGRRFSQPILGA